MAAGATKGVGVTVIIIGVGVTVISIGIDTCGLETGWGVEVGMAVLQVKLKSAASANRHTVDRTSGSISALLASTGRLAVSPLLPPSGTSIS